jgi:hypothetical protein
MKKLIHIIGGLIVAQLAGTAAAASEQGFIAELTRDKVVTWQFSPLTYHFTQDDEHKPVVMVGLEREYPSAKLDGITFFTNSFGQPTIYLYPWGGVYKTLGGIEHLSFKWTAGVMYGYREPYENKVPLNFRGFSLAAIPALAYEFKPGWTAQVNFLGTAGLMFQLNAPFN